MSHTLKLTNGAAALLTAILSHAEALTTIKEKFAAGVLIESSLSQLPKPPQEGLEEWTKQDWQSIDLSETQRDAAKTAIKFAVTKGIVPAGPFLNCLISQLGLNE